MAALIVLMRHHRRGATKLSHGSGRNGFALDHNVKFSHESLSTHRAGHPLQRTYMFASKCEGLLKRFYASRLVSP